MILQKVLSLPIQKTVKQYESTGVTAALGAGTYTVEAKSYAPATYKSRGGTIGNHGNRYQRCKCNGDIGADNSKFT